MRWMMSCPLAVHCIDLNGDEAMSSYARGRRVERWNEWNWIVV